MVYHITVIGFPNTNKPDQKDKTTMIADSSERTVKITNPALGISRTVSLVFDLEGVSEITLLKAAVASWVITAQAKLRREEAIRGISDGDVLHFDPEVDFINRVKATPLEKARKAVSTLSDEDLTALGLTRS